VVKADLFIQFTQHAYSANPENTCFTACTLYVM